jgi:glycosyltransferase 2 family protein
MSRILRRVPRWLPGLLLSLLAIAILAVVVPWEAVALAFSRMDWRLFPLFAVGYFASVTCRSMVSRTLLKRVPTLRQSFITLMQGYLLNNILPLRLGELGRAFLLSNQTGLGTLQVFSTVVIERVYDLAISASLLLVTLPLVLQSDWLRPVAFATLAIVLLALFSLYLMARYRDRLHGLITQLGARFRLVKRYILPGLDSFLRGLAALTDARVFAPSLGWMTINWAIGSAAYFALLRAFVPGAPFWWILFVLGVVSLGAALPSAPAALGVFEGSIVAALALLGVDSGTALAFAVTWHAFHFAATLITGLYGFAEEGQGLMDTYHRLLRRGSERAGEGLP